MTISNFRRAINNHGGVHRKFRWRINVTLPAGLASNEELREFSFLATTTAYPKSELGEVMVPYDGRELALPGDRKYEPLNVTFILTQDTFGHDLMEQWSQLFNGDDTNTAAGTFEDLVADWTLELLDQNDNAIKEVVLEDGWPKEVGEIELDKASQDEFGTFNFILRYVKTSNANSR